MRTKRFLGSSARRSYTGYLMRANPKLGLRPRFYLCGEYFFNFSFVQVGVCFFFWRFFVGLSHSVVVFYLHQKYFPKTSVQLYSFCCILIKKKSPIYLQRFNNYYFTTSEETKIYSGFILHQHIQFYIILRKLGVLNMIVILYILCLKFCIHD